MQGNFPDGYCFRIRATLEFCHQDRVAARLYDGGKKTEKEDAHGIALIICTTSWGSMT